MHKLIATLILVTLIGRAAHALPCAGDCNLDGRVTTEEIVLASHVASHPEDLSICEAADIDHNNSVSADELSQAIDSALMGCPYAPHQRPTAAEGCTNGFLVGEITNLQDSNVTTTPVELTKASGSITTIDGGQTHFVSAQFQLCPIGNLQRVVGVTMRSPAPIYQGDFFVDGEAIQVSYQEARPAGPPPILAGWTARDGVVVIDAMTSTSLTLHLVGLEMEHDSGGSMGTFRLAGNGFLDIGDQ